jgi:hypothetical protein
MTLSQFFNIFGQGKEPTLRFESYWGPTQAGSAFACKYWASVEGIESNKPSYDKHMIKAKITAAKSFIILTHAVEWWLDSNP